MAIKVGHHIIGLKGTIKNRKGYIIHIEPDHTVWLRMESGEVVTNVPNHAFQGRKGRPANVHSIIADKRSVYSDTPSGGGGWDKLVGALAATPLPSTSETVTLGPIVQGNGEYVAIGIVATGEVVSAPAEHFNSLPHVKTEDDLEREDNAPLWDGTCGVLPPISALEPKIKPKLPLIGMDGNAFYILGMAMNAGKKAGWTAEQLRDFKNEATSGDYDHLLATVCEHFDVGSEDDED